MSRFLLSCGGTGGHLSPGVSLAEGLISRGHEVTLLISRKQVDARHVEKYPHLHFERMPGRGFSMNPVGFVKFMASQATAFGYCLSLVQRMKPDAIVGFGGFTSAPAALAGWVRGIPVALHESNRIPGLAIRFLGRFSDRVYLPPGIRISAVRPSAIVHVGLPVRGEIIRLPGATAREALGLDPNRKVLAVLGGSQGASALNDWTRANLERLAGESIQVYCVTGLGKGSDEVLEIPSRSGEKIRAVFTPFCDRVAELLSAADLVISRAGAGTLAELVRCERPAILVPYPYAASNHQRANASLFERQGGGIVIEQAALGGLHAEVLDLIFNDWLLRKFRANLRRMDRANSLDLMLNDLEALAKGERTGHSARPAMSLSA